MGYNGKYDLVPYTGGTVPYTRKILDLFQFIRTAPQAKTFFFFANSADPDETAHYEPSHQDLHFLLICY